MSGLDPFCPYNQRSPLENRYQVLKFILITITAAVLGAHAGAEETSVFPGADEAIYSTDDGLKCYEYPQYLIMESGLVGSVGSDIFVKYKKGNVSLPCAYHRENSDFEIKNESAEYFFGVIGDLMFLDSGTGPDPRVLIIYDLQKKKKVHETFYSEPLEANENKELLIWSETRAATNASNCPQLKELESEGLGAAIEVRVKLNLKSFTATPTKEKRCASRQ